MACSSRAPAARHGAYRYLGSHARPPSKPRCLKRSGLFSEHNRTSFGRWTTIPADEALHDGSHAANAPLLEEAMQTSHTSSVPAHRSAARIAAHGALLTLL